MKFLSLLPPEPKTWEEITGLSFEEDGKVYSFNKGDAVTLEHVPTGSVAHGTLGDLFGVGRIRGVRIVDTAFGLRSFYFGQPKDELSGWRLRHYSADAPTISR